MSNRDLLERIQDLEDEDREDLGQEMPEVEELLEALEEGYDVEDMLDDFGIDVDAVEEYLKNV